MPCQFYCLQKSCHATFTVCQRCILGTSVGGEGLEARDLRQPSLCLPVREKSRGVILKIHSRRMNLMRGIDLKKIAGKMNAASGAELKAVCTKAGMFACRETRVHVTQEDFEMAGGQGDEGRIMRRTCPCGSSVSPTIEASLDSMFLSGLQLPRCSKVTTPVPYLSTRHI